MLFPLLLFAAAISTGTADMTPPASAELCGRCHRGIQEAWKTSSHAHAMESSLFQDVLQLAEGDFGRQSPHGVSWVSRSARHPNRRP